jgi:hypothetical protein
MQGRKLLMRPVTGDGVTTGVSHSRVLLRVTPVTHMQGLEQKKVLLGITGGRMEGPGTFRSSGCSRSGVLCGMQGVWMAARGRRMASRDLLMDMIPLKVFGQRIFTSGRS